MHTRINSKYRDDLFIISNRNQILFEEGALEPVEVYLHLKGFFLSQTELKFFHVTFIKIFIHFS